MKWYWRVRLYNLAGMYWHCQVETGRDLQEIDTVKDFYEALTGCKMLLEGMSEGPTELESIKTAFKGLWVSTP